MKKQCYWFRVTFGKWENDQFDSDSSNMFIEAWSAYHACVKAEQQCDDGEIVIGVEFLGYKQI